jgi:hypothetical protein
MWRFLLTADCIRIAFQALSTINPSGEVTASDSFENVPVP